MTHYSHSVRDRIVVLIRNLIKTLNDSRLYVTLPRTLIDGAGWALSGQNLTMLTNTPG